jgi:hypothetical protein
MKRTRYDSEYDEIRRAAGLDQPEFPEVAAPRPSREDAGKVDDAAAGRIRAMAQERSAELAARATADEEAKKAKLAAETIAFNERIIVAEYAARGLIPVRNENGQLISLALHKYVQEHLLKQENHRHYRERNPETDQNT